MRSKIWLSIEKLLVNIILLLESAKKEELLVTRTIASVAISTSQEQKSNIRTANGIPYRNPVNEWNTVINSGKK
jgi:hypothetical protein